MWVVSNVPFDRSGQNMLSFNGLTTARRMVMYREIPDLSRETDAYLSGPSHLTPIVMQFTVPPLASRCDCKCFQILSHIYTLTINSTVNLYKFYHIASGHIYLLKRFCITRDLSMSLLRVKNTIALAETKKCGSNINSLMLGGAYMFHRTEISWFQVTFVATCYYLNQNHGRFGIQIKYGLPYCVTCPSMSTDPGSLNPGTRRSRVPGWWDPGIRTNTGAGDTVLAKHT